MSNSSQLFDYTVCLLKIFTDKLEQNTSVYAPITFEEIVMIVIREYMNRNYNAFKILNNNTSTFWVQVWIRCWNKSGTNMF